MLRAGGLLLFGGSGYAGPPAPDLTFATSLASAGGGIGLRDPSGALVDSVAWGTATNVLVEGTAAAAPVLGKSAARHPDGHDTNQNASDFAEDDPSPGGAN